MLPLICLGQRLFDFLNSRAFSAACWKPFKLAIRHLKILSHHTKAHSFRAEIDLVAWFIYNMSPQHFFLLHSQHSSLQLCQGKHCSFVCLPLLCGSWFQIRRQPWYGCPTDTALGIFFWLLSNKITPELWETSCQMLVKAITVYMGLLERLWGHVEPRCKYSSAFKIIWYQLCRYMNVFVFGVSAS